MTFEKFEGIISKHGYGIVAMNYYTLNQNRFLYCVILNQDESNAIKGENKKSSLVFQEIVEKLLKNEGNG